uniref:Ras family protein n=1 Tax=Onchocerca volvulus TaxID=6282 RepID=A0A8R1XS86_ONCVO
MAHNSKLTIVFIGSAQKEALLEKIKSTAMRYERHIIYQDIHYLTYVVDGSEAIIELIDPGLEHTGARQMSIRKAHGVILFYKASSQSSINQLCDVAPDFQTIENKVKVYQSPIFLIANEDIDERSSEPAFALTFQKYKSDSVSPLMIESAAKIKTSSDLTKLQSQNVADLFGTYCKSFSVTIPNYDETLKFMEEMIRTIRLQQEQQENSLLQWFSKIKHKKTARKTEAKVDSKLCSIT